MVLHVYEDSEGDYGVINGVNRFITWEIESSNCECEFTREQEIEISNKACNYYNGSYYDDPN
jgi:hypothetical protein